MTTRRNLTDAELANWLRMARDGSLARYVGRKLEATWLERAALQREYRARLAGRVR